MTAERYSLDSWLEYHPSDDNMDREERSRRFLAHPVRRDAPRRRPAGFHRSIGS